jgi:soluble lytic murein transglycosylase-like protein
LIRKAFVGGLILGALLTVNFWSHSWLRPGKTVSEESAAAAQGVNLHKTVAVMLERTLHKSGQRWSDSQFKATADAIAACSAKYHYPPELILGLIQVESSMDITAHSSAGALGLTQVLPSTAREVARQLKLPYTTPSDLYKPGLNIRIGIAYLSSLENQMGSLSMALAGYNMGANAVLARVKVSGSVPRQVYYDAVFRNTQLLASYTPPK